MEFLKVFLHILRVGYTYLIDNSTELKDLTEIILFISGSVCAISGITYLRKLRDKKIAATFGFWSQLVVRLRMLKRRLEETPNIIINLYSKESRKGWTNSSAPPEENDINDFIRIAEETLHLISSSAEQIPAYKGWTNDYTLLVDFLDDVIRYDLRNGETKFKFKEIVKIEEKDAYYLKTLNAMSNMINQIDKSQKKAEKNIC